MGSTPSNRHGVAVFDFSMVSGCDQLVVGPTRARGETLDLLMTDVPLKVLEFYLLNTLMIYSMKNLVWTLYKITVSNI